MCFFSLFRRFGAGFPDVLLRARATEPQKTELYWAPSRVQSPLECHRKSGKPGLLWMILWEKLIFTHWSSLIVPALWNVPFKNSPTNQGLDPGIASVPPAILEEPFFMAIFCVPHLLLLIQFARKTTLLELNSSRLHSSTTFEVTVEPGRRSFYLFIASLDAFQR